LEGSTGDKNVEKAIKQLKLIADKVDTVGTIDVPWFPTRIEDFDMVGKEILGEGDGI